MKHLKFILTVFLTILYVGIFSETPKLKFNNGKFKIVQFTDLHWIAGNDFKKGNDSTEALILKVIKEEKPDLVVFTGDLIVSGGAAQEWRNMTKALVDTKTPFAVVFGNHDTETDLTKQQLLDVIKSIPYNIVSNADNNIAGVGNYVLPIESTNGNAKKWLLYMFDSHAYTKNFRTDTTFGYYDWIKNDQIQWYRKQSEGFTKENKGNPLPALAFFHIPIPEYTILRTSGKVVGNNLEGNGEPSLNSGLFTSFVEMGDVLGVFVGHAHNNDFIGVQNNIALGFGRKTGYNAAYKELLPRGARVIELSENESKFGTYIREWSGKYFDYSFKK